LRTITRQRSLEKGGGKAGKENAGRTISIQKVQSKSSKTSPYRAYLRGPLDRLGSLEEEQRGRCGVQGKEAVRKKHGKKLLSIRQMQTLGFSTSKIRAAR